MISVETSRSGHPILRYGDRYLSSTFDPLKEARAWVQTVTEKIKGRRHAFVLGLGSGYHVRELSSRHPDVGLVVIEPDAEIAARAPGIVEGFPRTRIIVEPDAERVLEHTLARIATRGVYAILKHPASVQTKSDYYTEVEELLLGRTADAFSKHLQLRPELAALLDMGKLHGRAEELVSVKSLDPLWREDARATSSLETAKWKILRELVI